MVVIFSEANNRHTVIVVDRSFSGNKSLSFFSKTNDLMVASNDNF